MKNTDEGSKKTISGILKTSKTNQSKDRRVSWGNVKINEIEVPEIKDIDKLKEIAEEDSFSSNNQSEIKENKSVKFLVENNQNLSNDK